MANTSYWPYISQGPIHFSLLMASYYLQIFGNCAVMRTKSSWLCFTILEHGQLKNVKRLPTSASLLSHSSSSVVEVLETRRKFLGASISEKNDKADNFGDTETHSQRLWTSKQQTQVTLNCQLLIFSSSCSSNTFLFVFL